MTQATEDDLEIHEEPAGSHQEQHYLVEYVLVDHMRTIGAHFDAHATALDHRTWTYRSYNAFYQRLKKAPATDDHSYEAGYSSLDRAMGRLGDSVTVTAFHFAVSFCDRQRIMDAILKLSDTDILAVCTGIRRGWTRERAIATAAASRAVADRLAAIVGEVVTIAAKSAIQITQGTEPGETESLRTYDPNVEDAEQLLLSECAINDVGARIEALAQQPQNAATVSALTIRNDLTGRVITLTPATNTLGLTAMTVRHNSVRTLYASDLRVAWTLSSGVASVSPPPATPTP